MSKYRKKIAYRKPRNPKLEEVYHNIEQYGTEVQTAITISSQQTYPLLEVWEQYYCQWIEDNLKNFRLELYPELSPSGRLHYHGYLYLYGVKDVLLWYLLPQYDEMNIMMKLVKKTQEDIVKWNNYVTKQSSFWRKLKEEKLIKISQKLNNRIIMKKARPISNKQIFQRSALDYMLDEESSEGENVQ